MSDAIATLETNLKSSVRDTTWDALVLYAEDTAESFAELGVPAIASKVTSRLNLYGSDFSSLFREGGTNGIGDDLV
ncbi:MAG TPA: hypothetical protein VMB73_18565 [Acetobacteraceae bacterium]|jgi:hypothetical protein|nr:hypothetical protein [Acetobacteraceae bacterium]